MDTNALVGCIVIAAALALLTYLVLWGRRTINRIAGSGSRSAREIARELRRGG
jgi:multisubunit Na+/H+ antiporter MnhF subunit